MVKVLAILAVVDLASFVAFSLAIGGDALNGVSVNGRYFVAMHGYLREVSRSVWYASRIQAISVLALWSLTIALVLAPILRRRGTNRRVER